MHLLNESLSQIYLDKEAISEFKQSYLKQTGNPYWPLSVLW